MYDIITIVVAIIYMFCYFNERSKCKKLFEENQTFIKELIKRDKNNPSLKKT